MLEKGCADVVDSLDNERSSDSDLGGEDKLIWTTSHSLCPTKSVPSFSCVPQSADQNPDGRVLRHGRVRP